MKPTMIILFLILALDPGLFSQDCSTFFPFEEGTVREYTIYDKKEKPEATMTHEIIRLATAAEGGIEAEVATRMVDKKGKEVHSGAYTVKCKDDIFYSDVSNLMPAEMMESLGSMEVTVEGTEMVLPSSLEVGQSLPDANTNIKTATGGISMMNWSVEVTNRKVAAREKISTAAGEFECFKITYDTRLKSIIGKSYSGADWVAKDVGVVRSETFDKNGKLDGYMELTSLTEK